MKTYTIAFNDRETLPDQLAHMAADLGITPEQLIMRFVAEGMAACDPDDGPSVAGTSLDDFMVKNGILRRTE